LVALSVPLLFAIFTNLLYILRFNLKKPFNSGEELKKVPGEDTHLIQDEFELLTDDEYLHCPHEHKGLRIASVCLFSCIFGFCIVLFLVLTWITLGPITGAIVTAMLLSVAFILFKRYEKDSADALIGFFLTIIFILGAIFIIGSIDAYNDGATQSYAETGVYFNATNPFSICSYRWEGFSIVDFGFFANLAYVAEPYFTQDLNTWFPDCPGCAVVYRFNKSVTFYDFYIPVIYNLKSSSF
jgi:hypothetical protein